MAALMLDFDRLVPAKTPAALNFPRSANNSGHSHWSTSRSRASGGLYLATEGGLADRLVVLKVLTIDHDEHLRLAQLQNTHIIPLFSEHTSPDRGLRALCMPYLGGGVLDRLLDDLAAIPPAEARPTTFSNRSIGAQPRRLAISISRALTASSSRARHGPAPSARSPRASPTRSTPHTPAA